MRSWCLSGTAQESQVIGQAIRKDDKLSVWASFKVREGHNEVEAEAEGRLSIAQDLLRNAQADFLRRIIAPNDGVGVRVSPLSLLSA